MNKNNMDIFTNGYVKQDNEEDLTEKIEIDEDLDNSVENTTPDVTKLDNADSNDNNVYDNQQQKNKNIENSIKNNNIQNAEVAEKLVKQLENERDSREKKEKHNKNKKNIIFLIGIILEIVIIVFLVRNRYLNNNESENYENQLTCTNNLSNENQDYSITTNNVYYFDKENKTAKMINSIIYIFNNKIAYDNYKNNFKSKSKTDFLGMEEEDIFDDINYVYENKITYNYNKLKENKEVTFKDDTFTFKLPNATSETTIFVDTYENTLEQNKNAGFDCQ